MDFTANTGIVSSHSIHHQRHHDLSMGLNFCNTTVVAPEFTPGFSGVRVARCLIFYAMFCRSLFVIFLLAIDITLPIWFCLSEVCLLSANLSPSIYLQYSQRHTCTMINHCDRRITLLSDTNISFVV